MSDAGPLSTSTAPDAPYAAALKVDPAMLAAPEPAPTPQEAKVAEAVRHHLSVARPDPASFPAIATQILELVRYPDVDLNELSRYIRVDGALAGGVLALANSAVYKAVRRIETVRDAVARLGISEVARLAAAISMRSLYSADAATAHARFEPIWTGLFLHAATTARAASELAKQKLAAVPGAEQTFMAGLLHDVGKGVALRALAELVGYGKLPALEAPLVARVLHLVHVDVGAEMHAAWRLPPNLAEVARHHHAAAVPAGPEKPLVDLVRLVSAVDLLRREPDTHPRAAAEAVESARALGVSPARLEAIGAELAKAEEWVRTVFPQ
jgi:putative nucleotidyltransferase with HDIG domain